MSRNFITYEPRFLTAASYFAGKKDVRNYLNGIALLPLQNKPGVVIAATNGHVLFMGFDEKAIISEPMLISDIKAPQLNKLKKARIAELTADNDDTRPAILEYITPSDNKESCTCTATNLRNPNMRYPDIESIIPTFDPNKASTISSWGATVMDCVVKGVLALGTKHDAFTIHSMQGTFSAGIIKVRDEHNVGIIIMPIRSNEAPITNNWPLTNINNLDYGNEK